MPLALAALSLGCGAAIEPPRTVPALVEDDGEFPERRKEVLVAEPPETSPVPDSGLTDKRVNQDASGRNQNETSIVVNPANPLNVVGAWNDEFVITPGQSNVIGYGWTTDGGQTWQSSRINFSTLPATQSTGDPAVTADSQGNFYLGILAFYSFDSVPAGVLMARSTDGGATFSEPVRLDDGGDKEYPIVDLRNDNIYVVWTYTHTLQQIFFSKSVDHGLSYTPRRQISTNDDGLKEGAAPSVGPNGEIYVVWSNYVDTIWFQRSLDAGASWLGAERAVRTDVVKPDGLNGAIRNRPNPAIATDTSNGPYRGRIYVVWADARFGDPDILLVHSDNNGTSWSDPVRVNDDAQGNGAEQFFPWVHVDANGHVHVTFLDRRDDPGNWLFGATLATSTDGGDSFGPNVRVSDGIHGPSNVTFLGDYTGASSGGGKLHVFWPDGRNGNPDVFSSSVDTADYDLDGVLNDGSGDGQYANLRCTGGQTVGCDDNCPGTPNPLQEDGDGDLVGDACDDCPTVANTNQLDFDRDTFGDLCDACPTVVGQDDSDPDGDGVAACVDNCKAVANADQTDSDGDGAGDACDACPFSSPNDVDGDKICGDVDNCPTVRNAAQRDTDGDGRGDLCDLCPQASDPAQTDSDGDGAGDACDCQPSDATDRRPSEVPSLTATRGASNATALSWTTAVAADVYQISRGTLRSFATGDYGSCLVQGLAANVYTDGAVPPPDAGFFYLVAGQSFDCGAGPLGSRSDESERVNVNPAACAGLAHTDVHPSGETAVSGTVTGTFNDTATSNDVRESIKEILSSGGNPNSRFSFLEHRWTFNVPAGSVVELHVEGSRSSSLDADAFRFEWSTGGAFTAVSLADLPTSEDNTDLAGPLPATLSGSVTIRVVDTNRSPGGQVLDTVSIDEIFIRVFP